MAPTLPIKHRTFDLNNLSRKKTDHDQLFQSVHKSGRRQFDRFKLDLTEQCPFEPNIKERAAKISTKALRSLQTHQTATGWRKTLEPEIFARFEQELECTKCHQALWDAGQTPSRDTDTPLKLCDCDASANSSDPVAGKPIFECSDSVAGHHGGKSQQLPTLVYGICHTDSSHRFLKGINRIPTFAENNISATFAGACQAPMFPFLVTEAGAADTKPVQRCVERETATAICTLLKLQYGLLRRTKDTCTSKFVPLVWVISNKGEHWRVAAAQIESGDSAATMTYRMDTLWEGQLGRRSDALQLLLIIDRILDWARDHFRPDVIARLSSLIDFDGDHIMTSP